LSCSRRPIRAGSSSPWSAGRTCSRSRELRKEAASTALALMFSYPEDFELADRMSRLAREELRHFELVQQQLTALKVPFRRLSPSRYAEGLRKALRRTEHERRMDLLLVGALMKRARTNASSADPVARGAARPVLRIAGGGRSPACRALPASGGQAREGARSDCSSSRSWRRSWPWRRTRSSGFIRARRRKGRKAGRQEGQEGPEG